MANWKTALTHHGHLSKALKSQDHAKAQHHVGHIMAALRSTAGSNPAQDEPDGAMPVNQAPVPEMAPMGMRARLAAFAKRQ
jgi:hypothetical protein